MFQMVPGGTPEYYHGNQIGTTRLMTGFGDPWPVVTREAVHTAFGELKWTEAGSTATRYGYAGAHGYEEGLMPQYGSSARFPYLHVGARWYDPLTGRFLQRDPIGIAGGLNWYEYADSSPLVSVDPWGMMNDWSVSGPFPPGWDRGSLYGAPHNPGRPPTGRPASNNAVGAQFFIVCTNWLESKPGRTATRYSAAAMRGATTGAVICSTAGGLGGLSASGGPGGIAGFGGGLVTGFLGGWVAGILGEGLGDLGIWDRIGWDPRKYY
jgi:RHS repeat-associated protein